MSGTPINRQWVQVLVNGTIVVDWGDDLFQDVFSGDFIQVMEVELGHAIQDEELEILKRAGRVDQYNKLQVFFLNLPDRPYKTIE